MADCELPLHRRCRAAGLPKCASLLADSTEHDGRWLSGMLCHAACACTAHAFASVARGVCISCWPLDCFVLCRGPSHPHSHYMAVAFPFHDGETIGAWHAGYSLYMRGAMDRVAQHTSDGKKLGEFSMVGVGTDHIGHGCMVGRLFSWAATVAVRTSASLSCDCGSSKCCTAWADLCLIA